MRKLYEINADIERCIMENTDPETGEFNAVDEIEALHMEWDAKIEGVALFAKDCRAEAKAIKDEIDTLRKRYDRLIRNADGAEGWVANALGGQRFSTSKVDCVFRKSEAVEVDDWFCEWADMNDLEYFLTIKHTVTPNKAEIKKALKSGRELQHCQLVEKQNMTIK